MMSSRQKASSTPNVRKPKNLSSWNLFCNEFRSALKAQFPQKKSSEITKLLAQKWSAMTDSQKEPYSVEAQKLRKEYEAQHRRYVLSKDDESTTNPTTTQTTSRKRKRESSPKIRKSTDSNTKNTENSSPKQSRRRKREKKRKRGQSRKRKRDKQEMDDSEGNSNGNLMGNSDGNESESSLSSELESMDIGVMKPGDSHHDTVNDINPPPPKRRKIMESSSDWSDDEEPQIPNAQKASNGPDGDTKQEKEGPVAVTGMSLKECILNNDNGVEMPSTVAAREQQRKEEEEQEMEQRLKAIDESLDKSLDTKFGLFSMIIFFGSKTTLNFWCYFLR